MAIKIMNNLRYWEVKIELTIILDNFLLELNKKDE